MQRRLAGARRCLTLVCKSAPLPSVSVTRKAIFLPLICPTCQTETAATRGSRLSQEHTKWAIVRKIRLAEKHVA